MSLEFVDLTADPDAWNRYVDHEHVTGATPFHRAEALRVLEAHSKGTLHCLVGLHGDEPVGLLPVFETTRYGRPAVVSPPHILESFSLGPVLNTDNTGKRRRREQTLDEFVSGSVQWLHDAFDPEFVHLRGTTDLTDVRCYRWADFDATPDYTYHVDLTADEETIKSRFSRNIRRNIKDLDDHRLTFELGDRDDIGMVLDLVRDRHEQQDKSYRVTPAFVTDLADALPDGTVRTHVAVVDGDPETGIIAIHDDDRVYRWQGAVDPGVGFPVVSLLDWHIMQTAKAEGASVYDLGGANMKRLTGFKAKLGPELAVYYNLRWRSTPMALRQMAAATVAPAVPFSLPGPLGGYLTER
ncbi:GNAT family N-acetyltransferase [Haloferax larsenii]|uniref:Acetyltransferase involved in cellulose biosynthesis, CelD/BcsL family n=1 Tax=Haloferax larsenii TaxID=302484 RepID=A0A1H7QI78_HALLR|nr:GNAT family N-acetyltransferase [Haloferax larsenii]SEL47662.1 Acetyltransferase involved in cellulose biosynthesis, CelD/BcsL family [Haloferax larsenii]